MRLMCSCFVPLCDVLMGASGAQQHHGAMTVHTPWTTNKGTPKKTIGRQPIHPTPRTSGSERE